jgi:hypothetical protein
VTTVNTPALKQQPTTTHKIDNQVLADEDMKKKWDEAKGGKETTAALIAIHEILLHDANQIIRCIMGDLVQLVEQYARLSLAGSCSAQVSSAVGFLERVKGMEGMGFGQVKLKKVTESLGYMKKKLEFLNKLEEDAQKGVSG